MSRLLARGFGLILLLLGVLIPADKTSKLVISLINPNTVIRPEWIQELVYLKLVLIAFGLIIFIFSFLRISFNEHSSTFLADNSRKAIGKFLLVLLFLSFIIGAYWASRPLAENIGSVYQDDYFYFLKIADNALHYGKVTFDGDNVSNGFQPLWMVVLMFYHSIFSDKFLLIKIASITLALVHALTAYMLYKILSLYKHEVAGAFLAIFWAFNPFTLWMALAGFETTFSLFFLSSSIYWYLKCRSTMTPKESIILGAFLGLAFLSRLDSIFFSIPIAIDYLFINKARFIDSFKRLIPCGIIHSLLALPWFAYSYVSSSVFSPISGAAKTFAANVDYYSGAFDFVIKRSFTMLAMIKEGMWFLGFWNLQSMVIAASIALLWFSLVLWLVRKQGISLKPAAFLIIFSILLTGYYTFTHTNIRYLMPVIMLAMLCTAIVFAKSYANSSSKQFMKISFFLIMLLLIGNMAVSSISASKTGQMNSEWNPLQNTMYNEGIGWMRENTKQDEIIGSFNAGVYGYFSGRKIVNLDGVINNEAYYALKERKLYDYLRSERIKYVIDWRYVEDYYLLRFGGGDIKDNLREIAVMTPSKGVFKNNPDHELVVYEVLYEA